MGLYPSIMDHAIIFIGAALRSLVQSPLRNRDPDGMDHPDCRHMHHEAGDDCIAQAVSGLMRQPYLSRTSD
jgi:hypothetical protein